MNHGNYGEEAGEFGGTGDAGALGEGTGRGASFFGVAQDGEQLAVPGVPVDAAESLRGPAVPAVGSGGVAEGEGGESRAKRGKCSVCGRPLRDPVSLARGMGAVCAGKVKPGHGVAAMPRLFQNLRQYGIHCWRENGMAKTNVPHEIVHHSPDGFEWGYDGSGPAELALNTLHCFLPPQDHDNDVELGGVTIAGPTAYLYQQFKRDFLSAMPKEGGRIDAETIRNWIQARVITSYPLSSPPSPATGPAPGHPAGQQPKTPHIRPGLSHDGEVYV